MATRSKGPGRPKGSTADEPNKGSKLALILDIIRPDLPGRKPAVDLADVKRRAAKKLGGEPSLSLLYKVRRYLTKAELNRFFP